MPLSPRQSRSADGRTTPSRIGAATAVFGLLVLVGRLVGVIEVSHVLPRGTSAVMFLLAGLSLMVAASPQGDPRVRRGLALSVVVIAVLCAVGQITHEATTSPLGDGGGVSPVPTAVAFLFSGIGLLCFRTGRTWLYYLPTLITGLIVLVAVYGYTLGLRPTSSALAGTSPGSLAGLAALTAGLLALSPHLPPFVWLAENTSGARLARRLVPTITLLPLVLGYGLTEWHEATGLSQNVGTAAMLAFLTATLTATTAVSIRYIDRAELRARHTREAAEAAVHESERQFRSLAVEMPAGVLRRDESGAVTFVNEEVFRILGLAPDGPFEALRPEQVHPDDRDPGVAAMQHTIATGEPYEMRVRVFRPGGEMRHLIVRGTRQDNADGSFASYLSTMVDITEQARAEAAERNASAEFRIAFDQAPIGIVVAGLDGVFQRVNAALCRMSGFSEAELMAHTPLSAEHPERSVVHPDDFDRVAREFGRLGEESDTLSIEHRWRHKDGHAMWVDARVTLIRDDQGEPDHVISQILDITDQRSHEDQLQHMAEHDALTGLLNRRGFEARIHEHVAKVRRYGDTGSLLMLDLDGFKQVNDTLGHATGDALIVGVAGALSERLRETDIVARLGGDEFAVILPGESGEQALEAARTLLRVVRENAAAFDARHSGQVTASIGVANFTAGLTAEEILIRGDLAMYHAKEAGKNQVASYCDVSDQREPTPARSVTRH